MAGSGQHCLEIFVKGDYVVGIFQVHKRITLPFLGNRKEMAECPGVEIFSNVPVKVQGRCWAWEEGGVRGFTDCLAVPKKQVMGVRALDVPELQKSCFLVSEVVARETNSQRKESGTTVGLDRKGFPFRPRPSWCCLPWDGMYPKTLTSASL